MLLFDNRLKKEKDFKNVFSLGKHFNLNSVGIIRFKENNQIKTRFGFVVSKKVSLKAVKRNRIKRILREQVRKRINMINDGWDIVIITRPNIINLSSLEIGIIIEKSLRKIGVIK